MVSVVRPVALGQGDLDTLPRMDLDVEEEILHGYEAFEREMYGYRGIKRDGIHLIGVNALDREGSEISFSGSKQMHIIGDGIIMGTSYGRIQVSVDDMIDRTVLDDPTPI